MSVEGLSIFQKTNPNISLFSIMFLKDINVPVPGKRFSLYPIFRLLIHFKSIYVLAGWDLLFPFNVQGCKLWEWNG